MTNKLPLRTSCVIIDMAGPYEILCETKTCEKKVWVLLILNPATQFLELEILDDSSSASIVSGLIRYMSHHGNKISSALIWGVISGHWQIGMPPC